MNNFGSLNLVKPFLRKKSVEEPREAEQATDEDIQAVDHQSTEVKAEFAEKPTES